MRVERLSGSEIVLCRPWYCNVLPRDVGRADVRSEAHSCGGLDWLWNLLNRQLLRGCISWTWVPEVSMRAEA